MLLFREEVFEHRKHKLQGNVQLAVPVSWQLVSLVLFLIVASGLALLALTSYSRIETVSGLIVPKQGLAQIVPSRRGTVENLLVEEGEIVKPGAPLAVIKTGEFLDSGDEGSASILRTLGQQEQGLRRQEQQIDATAMAEKQQFEAQISGLQVEMAALRQQISIQQRLVESSRRELELAQGIAERGFVSRRDIAQREEIYLGRQRELTQLIQQLSSRRSDIERLQAAIRQSSSTAEAQIAALSGQRSDVVQRRTSAEIAAAFQLVAPVGGQITALVVREGQVAGPEAPIMIIVPENATFHAELYIPSSAIGFLEPGQEVRVALDAFPFQRFGTLRATIISIASAPIMRPGPENTPVAVYLVVAELDRASINAYGKETRVIAGMTLTARIVTEKQSLFEWLFEPLLAVRNR